MEIYNHRATIVSPVYRDISGDVRVPLKPGMNEIDPAVLKKLRAEKGNDPLWAEGWISASPIPAPPRSTDLPATDARAFQPEAPQPKADAASSARVQRETVEPIDAPSPRGKAK